MELSIIFLPLIASIISGFFGRYIGDRNSEIVTSALVSISALLSIHVLYQVIVNQYEENIVIATWINSGSLNVNWSMLIDPLSAVMLVVVTSVFFFSSYLLNWVYVPRSTQAKIYGLFVIIYICNVNALSLIHI